MWHVASGGGRVLTCCCSVFLSPEPSGAPQNFTAIGMGSSSVKLQWDLPARKHRNGEIIKYELMYHKRSDETEDYTTNTTDTYEIIEGLEMNTDYIFKIRAYTSMGPGPWSNRLPFRTFGHCTYSLYRLVLGSYIKLL